MDLDEIQNLANLVKDTDLYELEIERENMRLKIVNQGSNMYPVQHISPVPSATGGQLSTIIHEDEKKPNPSVDDPTKFHVIRSPIVGTFYSAPSPEAPDFVTKGVPVDVSSTVGIIEAMKVMNEIQAEVRGVVVDIMVENGQAVEFGQPLFKVKKS